MSGYVPPELLEEILQKTDIVELVSEYLTLKKQGKNYLACCPFHSESSPSFSVSPEKQIFYCFGCQKGGNALNFVMEMEALTLPEAAAKLASRVGVQIPERSYTPREAARRQEQEQLLRAHQLAAAFYRKQLFDPHHKVGAAYCGKRGLTRATVEAFGIGFAPEQDWELLSRYLQEQGFAPALLEKAGLVSKSAKTGRYYDKFHGRLIFPIADYRGNVVAFGGRIIGEGEPKYLNSTQTPIYNKSQHLYGLAVAAKAIRQQDLAVIMEGYMDVVAAHQHGVTNAVASLGTAFTAEQARLLKRYTTNVLLSYDGDSAGAKAAQRALPIINAEGINVRVLTLPPEDDPDSFLRREGLTGWQRYVKEQAQGTLEYLLRVAEAHYPQPTITDKGRIIQELTPAIVACRSHVERDSFIRLLAGHLGVSTEIIYADLSKHGIKNIASPVAAAAPATVAKAPSVKKTNPLLALILQNREYFLRMTVATGDDFCRYAEEKQLVQLVKQLGDGYDWQLSTLLHILPPENEGLRQLLLNLLQTELPSDDPDRLLDSWIKQCRIDSLQRRIRELRQLLTARPPQAKSILQEISALQRQVQELKSQD